jgi:arylsulfatase A-like enzyme/Tfp pilus assembly protein PilF
MAVSNRKRKAILRGHPSKSPEELAAQLDLSVREVRAVLKEAGRLSRPSLKTPIIIFAAALALTGILISAYALLAGPGPAKLARARGGLNVLVVVIDTLRADRLGCYGYQKARTPVADSLAESGVLFSRAFCNQPITLPSHATIFTGTHPAYHGVHDNGLFRLPEQAVTLAEILKDSGFTTAAIISSFVLHRQFGLDQGFDHYDDRLSNKRGETTLGFKEMPAVDVSDRAVDWLDRHTDERWMLWLHYFDPHAGYVPPQRFLEGVPHPYDGEVAYADFELGRIIDLLERKGLRERTLIVFTSDHGEGLDEHGEPTHAVFLYNSTAHVPLIISLPGVIPGGKSVGELVSLMDIMPTILDALGLKIPDQVRGRSLVPRLFKDTDDRPEVPVIMETMAPWHQYGWSPLKAIVEAGHKFIEAPRPELYDLEADPRELRNIYERNRGRAEAMARLLKRKRAEYEADSLASRAERKMDARTREKLASLGYVFTGAGAKEPSIMAPDPKDMVEILLWTREAATLKKNGKTGEAIALMEKIVRRNPDNRRAMNLMGTWYVQAGALDRAEQIFKRIITIDPDFHEAFFNLGVIYTKTGRFEHAKIIAETLIARNPDHAKAYNLLGFAVSKIGDHAGAIAHYKKSIELFPTYDRAYFNMGLSLEKLGRRQEAYDAYVGALKLVPQNENYRRYAEQAAANLERK